MKKSFLLSILIMFALIPLINAAQYHPVVGVDIVKGDTLTNICKKYLENPKNWREIAKINRLSDPNRIIAGQRLVIPVDMLRGLPVDGIVTFVKGDVQFKESENQPWIDIRVKDRLKQGNLIKTGNDSGLEVWFEKNARFFIRSNTELKVKRIHRKGPLHWIYQMYLKTGRTITRVRRATGKEPRFEIHTPSAVAVTRGTEFRTTADSESTIRCEVIVGKLQVVAGTSGVMVEKGEGIVVRKDTPLGLPVKLLDAPRALNLDPIFKFQPFQIGFDDVKNALLYRVMVSKDPLFRDLVINTLMGIDEKLTINGLDDGTYYLQSRSLDENGLEGLPSKTMPIKIRINPVSPYLNSPLSQAKIRNKRVVFNWLNVKDAVGYDLQVSDHSEFKQIIIEERNLKKTEYNQDTLGFGRFYYRVRSTAADGYKGMWSDSITFEMVPEPPSPSLEPPEIGENEIRIRFKNLGDGFKYHIQMAKDEKFETILLDEVLSKPHKTIEKPKKSGNYFIRTSSIDNDNVEGKFCKPQSLEIKKKFPYDAAAFILTVILILII